MTTGNPLHARVFVVGLDGATFDLLDPWIRAGYLPTLARLAASGVSGSLESTYPPLTGPAWGSFMTGKEPVNHGVLEFFHRAPHEYRQILHSRQDLDGRSIWRVLSDAGLRVGVVGVPLTYPPEQVNGFLVTGLLTPRQPDVAFTYPRQLGQELDDAVGGYLLQHTEKYLQDDPLRLIREEESILDSLIAAALYLVESKPWDFFMLHVLGSDVMQHAFWHFMDPQHPEHDPHLVQRYGNPILDFWKRIDRGLGDVLAKLPPDTVVMAMSDHGFGRVIKYVNFNVWLLESGFMRLKTDARSRLRHVAFRLGYNYANAFKIGFRTGLVRKVIGLGRGKQEELQRQMFLSLDDVDWPHSQVYSVGNFGQMYVNLKGREPQGCVSPGREYEQVLQRLEEALRGMRDPETGEPVIGSIWRGADLFQGKYADRAPDLFFFTRDMEYKAMGLTDFGSNRVFDDLYGTHAHHRMNGLFMLAGTGVRQGERIEGVRLVDLAPTIYALMGVAVPQGLDGQVVHGAFVPGMEPDVAYELDSVHDAVSGGLASARDEYPSAGVPGSDPVYTAEEEAQIMEQLRNLGYAE